jgi:hypothetical protein
MPSAPVIAAELRNSLIERWGANGLRLARQQLREADSHAELRKGLAALGVRLADEDFETVAAAFAPGDLVNRIIGQLSARRKLIVEEAYKRLCVASGSDVADVDAMYRHFDPSRFPEVTSNKKTADECISDIVDAFSFETNPDGTVSFHEFADYYCGVAGTVADDKDFERLVLRSWNLDRPATVTRDQLEMTATRIPKSTAGRDHPLYQPASTLVGKNLQQAFDVPRAHNRHGAFTKHAPPPAPSSSLNTASTRSRVL